MTREEAIKWFEEAVPKNCSACPKEMDFSVGGWVTSCNYSDSLRCEAYFLARAALREQEVVSNADRIRAMTDEELARFLTWNVPDCASYCDDARCGCKWNCKHGDGLHVIRDWLQQPVKEDA